MIKCTECGNSFSEDLGSCPFCGCPTEYVKKDQAAINAEQKPEQTERTFWDKFAVRGLSNISKARKYIDTIHRLNVFFSVLAASFTFFYSIFVFVDSFDHHWSRNLAPLFFILIFVYPLLIWIVYYLIELFLGYAAMFIDLTEDIHSIKNEVSSAHTNIVDAIKDRNIEKGEDKPIA